MKDTEDTTLKIALNFSFLVLRTLQVTHWFDSTLSVERTNSMSSALG